MTTSPPTGEHTRTRTSWTARVGTLDVTLSAPSDWAAEQRTYLDGYLPTVPAESLPAVTDAFRLDIHPDRPPDQSGVRTGRVENVPGVVHAETLLPGGDRVYTPTVDTREADPEAYTVTVRGQHLTLSCHHPGARAHRYPLRLLREILLRTSENREGIVLHAAGVETGSAGVLVCGAAGAGKTTVMTELLRAVGAGLLSNDRVVLHGPDRLVPVPLPVSVARGTIDACPELLHAAIRPDPHRPRPALQDLPTTFGTRAKMEVSPSAYAAALGGRLSPGARLRLVLVPRLRDTGEPTHVRQLPHAEACQVLAASCFTPHDEFWTTPWLVPRERTDSELSAHAQEICDQVAAAFPVVEITHGVRQPAGADMLARVLTDVLRGAW